MEENIEPKKKMSDETKAKLTYSGELVVIALIVLVMGILRLTGVRGYNHTFRMIFNIITTAGAINAAGEISRAAHMALNSFSLGFLRPVSYWVIRTSALSSGNPIIMPSVF